MLIRCVVVFCFLLLGNSFGFAQEVPLIDYYVVIGAFSNMEDAEKLTEEANLKSFRAQYAFHESKKQYYVYLLHATEKKKAKLFLKRIRKETEYKNAHLMKGTWADIQ